MPLKWRPERKATLTNMVMNLVKYGNVQHHALARGLQTLLFKAKRERIRRFFAKHLIDEKVFADAMVFNTFNLKKTVQTFLYSVFTMGLRSL